MRYVIAAVVGGLYALAIASAVSGWLQTYADLSFLAMSGFMFLTVYVTMAITNRFWHGSGTSGDIGVAVIYMALLVAVTILTPVVVLFVGNVFLVTGIGAGVILLLETVHTVLYIFGR